MAQRDLLLRPAQWVKDSAVAAAVATAARIAPWLEKFMCHGAAQKENREKKEPPHLSPTVRTHGVLWGPRFGGRLPITPGLSSCSAGRQSLGRGLGGRRGEGKDQVPHQLGSRRPRRGRRVRGEGGAGPGAPASLRRARLSQSERGSHETREREQWVKMPGPGPP